MKIILDESYSLLDGPFIKLKPYHHNRQLLDCNISTWQTLEKCLGKNFEFDW